jgi:hypothetical protein
MLRRRGRTDAFYMIALAGAALNARKRAPQFRQLPFLSEKMHHFAPRQEPRRRGL